MPLIANLTLSQLRTATKAQIITAISNFLTNNFTRRQLVAFLLDAETVSDPPTITRRPDGQIESETIFIQDAETGQVLSMRRVNWTYYPTGEVNIITIQEGETLRTIRHYLDGRQPTVTLQASPKTAAPTIAPSRALTWWKPALIALALLALALLAFYFSRGA